MFALTLALQPVCILTIPPIDMPSAGIIQYGIPCTTPKPADAYFLGVSTFLPVQVIPSSEVATNEVLFPFKSPPTIRH